VLVAWVYKPQAPEAEENASAEVPLEAGVGPAG